MKWFRRKSNVKCVRCADGDIVEVKEMCESCEGTGDDCMCDGFGYHHALECDVCEYIYRDLNEIKQRNK